MVNARILARSIRNATLHIVRGGGHHFLLESPGELVQLMVEFLGRP